MRIISNRSLKECWKRYPDSRMALGIWEERIIYGEFKDHQDLRSVFPDADYIPNRQFRHLVVFNVKGNKYRLAADIFFNSGQLFLKWFGTHSEYDKIDFLSLTNGGFRIC